jgi:hypothetical protein
LIIASFITIFPPALAGDGSGIHTPPPSGRFSTDKNIYGSNSDVKGNKRGDGEKNGKPETYFAGTWLKKRSGNGREERNKELTQ